MCHFYSFTWVIQGELFVIDETNSIYYLPCGDLCEDNTYSDVSSNYSYLGCYDDDEDRVLSGDYLMKYAGMTTEVRRVCASKRGLYFSKTHSSCATLSDMRACAYIPMSSNYYLDVHNPVGFGNLSLFLVDIFASTLAGLIVKRKKYQPRKVFEIS